ncbi:MAG: tetratricopeptide repeat protein [Acidobacteria bacterium]|nr:tetratricopeptide repeat protein [Acidobacteriota bacterium]
MRASVTLLLFVSLASLGMPAEVIHLKNGRTIWADHVQEEGSHLQYEVGDSSYAIPKTLVEKIEAGGLAPQYASSATNVAEEMPALAPAGTLKNQDEFTAQVIHEGKVDIDALEAIEQQGDTAATATAYFIAGRHEFDRGNFAKARPYFDSALRADSGNPTILNYYAALLVRTGNASQALSYAERAVRSAPESPDALDILGYAQFSADRGKDAIQTWKRSLALRPDPVIQQFVARAEREAKVEANFSERESSHFTLRYEGKQTSESFRREVIATLEAEYDELVRDFGVSPRNSIPVILYADQSFFDVTQAPSWTGAVNDGKLRIPVQGLTSVNSELARILKHELAHSFINQLSNGRCPQWLHEGIAQAVEPKTLSGGGRRLAEFFAGQHAIPYNALEGSFLQFSGPEAALAYDQSLAAVEYILATYGMSDVRRILERLGEGSSTEAALRNTIHCDYRQMEAEVGKYLMRKYGN